MYLESHSSEKWSPLGNQGYGYCNLLESTDSEQARARRYYIANRGTQTRMEMTCPPWADLLIILNGRQYLVRQCLLTAPVRNFCIHH
jgi:hypothetical protein